MRRIVTETPSKYRETAKIQLPHRLSDRRQMASARHPSRSDSRVIDWPDAERVVIVGIRECRQSLCLLAALGGWWMFSALHGICCQLWRPRRLRLLVGGEYKPDHRQDEFSGRLHRLDVTSMPPREDDGPRQRTFFPHLLSRLTAAVGLPKPSPCRRVPASRRPGTRTSAGSFPQAEPGS
jgi:hypothetical protein